jgi:hypothetical protein
MRRLLVPVIALVALLAVPAAGQAATYGVSDQQASTFTNPLFAPLKLKSARYIAPYDVMDSPADKAALDAWIGAARASRARILVHFERSHIAGQERKLPSVAKYTSEIRKFHAAYPDVKEIGVWNEANRCQSKSRVAGQPTCKKYQRLASYYKAARSVFKAKGTNIVALDVLDQQNVTSALQTIRGFLRYAKPRPKILGFHNYSDTNRGSTTRTKRVLAAWRGDVWLTETGGQVKLGKALKANTGRAARALKCMFTMGRSFTRIKRLYIYQFNPAFTANDDFDAGLIERDGSIRPGYTVVRKRQRGSCSAKVVR